MRSPQQGSMQSILPALQNMLMPDLLPQLDATGHYMDCAWQAVMKELQTLLEMLGSVTSMLLPDGGGGRGTHSLLAATFSSAILEAEPRRTQTTFFCAAAARVHGKAT